MTKEKPKHFDEYLEVNFKWNSALSLPNEFDNFEYLGIKGDYCLYWAWDSDKEKGFLYRVKIKNVCEKCGHKLEV